MENDYILNFGDRRIELIEPTANYEEIWIEFPPSDYPDSMNYNRYIWISFNRDDLKECIRGDNIKVIFNPRSYEVCSNVSLSKTWVAVPKLHFQDDPYRLLIDSSSLAIGKNF